LRKANHLANIAAFFSFAIFFLTTMFYIRFMFLHSSSVLSMGLFEKLH